jgi:uncharacterized membrane protein YidH (DUF202 family)
VIAVGVALVSIGVWRYHHGRAWIEAGGFHPAHLSVLVTSLAALAVGLLAIVLVWLTPHG